MNQLTLTFLAVASLYASFVNAESDPVTNLTHGGGVRGLWQTVSLDSNEVKIRKFLGIPFAIPPTGSRRFAPPEPYPAWTGTRDTKNLPPTCWQYIVDGFDVANPAARMWLNTTQMSEDCLYLNVWVPAAANAGNPLPVMVWVYGGGYYSGTTGLRVYDGAILAASQNVIVVSMQYRVGALGFLRIDPARGTNSKNQNANTYSTVARGNQGLLDQALALKWTKDNIANFGGNPDEITVFGESAGAVSVSILWLAPSSHKYFRRMILQSGSIYARWALVKSSDAHNRARAFIRAINCPSPDENRIASIQCLQQVDPMLLVLKQDGATSALAEDRKATLKTFYSAGNNPQIHNLYKWASTGAKYFDATFGPVLDGDFIPRPPDERFVEISKASASSAPDLMIGVNKNEAMYFLLYGLQLHRAQFLHTNGTVELPHVLTQAGQRLPWKPNGSPADFHLITAAQILSEEMLVPGITELPAWFYALPTKSSSPDRYADPNEVKLTAESVILRLDALAGDLDFVCPTLNFAEKVAQIPNSKVFLYRFQHRTKSSTFPEWTGVMHGYEIEYVFGMPRSKEFQTDFYEFTPDERALSDKMMRMWANFAKYGNPNGNSRLAPTEPAWPQYKPNAQRSEHSPDHIILDTPITVASGLRVNECKFWLHQIPHLTQIVKQRERETCSGTCDGNGASAPVQSLRWYLWLTAYTGYRLF